MEQNYRHEYKYLISRQAAELLKRRLPHFMQRDSHAGPSGMVVHERSNMAGKRTGT